MPLQEKVNIIYGFIYRTKLYQIREHNKVVRTIFTCYVVVNIYLITSRLIGFSMLTYTLEFYFRKVQLPLKKWDNGTNRLHSSIDYIRKDEILGAWWVLK